MKKHTSLNLIEIRNKKSEIIPDIFGLSDMLSKIFELNVVLKDRSNHGEPGTYELACQMEHELLTLRALCYENEISFVAERAFPSRSHKYDECFACIIYSFERKVLFTITRSVYAWYTATEFLEVYDCCRHLDDFFVDPDRGVAHMTHDKDIAWVENFGALDYIPGALYDFLMECCQIKEEITNYVESESA